MHLSGGINRITAQFYQTQCQNRYRIFGGLKDSINSGNSLPTRLVVTTIVIDLPNNRVRAQINPEIHD
jgi:hypothetical protein